MYTLQSLKITCSRLYSNLRPTLTNPILAKGFARKVDEELKREFEKHLKDIQDAAENILVQISREISNEFKHAKKEGKKEIQQAMSEATHQLRKEFEKVKKEAYNRSDEEVRQAIDALKKQTENALQQLKVVVDSVKMLKKH